MKLLEGPWQEWAPATDPSSVTIGVLDGVHRGHRALLSRLDPSMRRTVLTFEPHPVEILRPGTPPRLITTLAERVELLEESGVTVVGVLDLGDIKDLEAGEFVEEVLVGRLQIGHLVVGNDFRFGRDRTGDVDLLHDLGGTLGFEVETIGLVCADEEPVSSSLIRQLIEAGDVDSANELLGSRFRVTNTVIDGDKRGRTIGFPTANLRPPERKVVPATGIYACFVLIDGYWHDAAVSVGVRPTFGGGELLIEAFVFDFDRAIYGAEVTVEFVAYTRPELAFEGVEYLVAQMEKDVSEIRMILEDVRSRM